MKVDTSGLAKAKKFLRDTEGLLRATRNMVEICRSTHGRMPWSLSYPLRACELCQANLNAITALERLREDVRQRYNLEDK